MFSLTWFSDKSGRGTKRKGGPTEGASMLKRRG